MTKKAKEASGSDLPRGIGQPAIRALRAIGITRLEEVATLTKDELLALHGVGPKATRVLEEALGARGLGFRR